MNVILNAAYNDRLAVQIDEDSAEITVHFLAQRFSRKKGRRCFVEKTVCTRTFESDWGMRRTLA